MRGELTVTYERDEDGWIVAAVLEVRGCCTQGETPEQARERIREALALFVAEEVAAQAVLSERVGPGIEGDSGMV
jgi:predicted RNase H-like HicB family nuclease